MTNIVTKKVLGTLFIGVAFIATSFIGANSASAFFSLTGKNLQFHAIVESKTANSMVLLTSSTDPITVTINNKTKYPFGQVNVGDVVFVVARVKNDSSVLALIIKKSQSGGPSDIYGTDTDDVTVKRSTFVASECPWLRVTNPLNWTTTIVFKVDANTKFVGTQGCNTLVPGDLISVTGVDTNENGFVAKTVIKHKKKNVQIVDENLPENESEQD
jgi:hypothetical protein